MTKRSDLTCLLLSSLALGCGGDLVSPNSGKAYLGVDGTFTIDTASAESVNDPRNPHRVVFQQMKTFSFFKDMAGKTPMATNCTYEYRGAKGDPFYYPEKSATSIWDLFALTAGDKACEAFKHVALRSPHGDMYIHMHMRYGDAASSFDALLNLSKEPEDKARFNPWWSVYCAEGMSDCDK